MFDSQRVEIQQELLIGSIKSLGQGGALEWCHQGASFSNQFTLFHFVILFLFLYLPMFFALFFTFFSLNSSWITLICSVCHPPPLIIIPFYSSICSFFPSLFTFIFNVFFLNFSHFSKTHHCNASMTKVLLVPNSVL